MRLGFLLFSVLLHLPFLDSAFAASEWSLALAKSCSDNTGDNGTVGEKDSGYNITPGKEVLVFLQVHNGWGYNCVTGTENAYVIEGKDASGKNIKLYSACISGFSPSGVSNWAKPKGTLFNASSSTSKYSALAVSSQEVRIGRDGRVYFYNSAAGADSTYWIFEK